MFSRQDPTEIHTRSYTPILIHFCLVCAITAMRHVSHDIWGFHSSVFKDSGLPGCDTVLLDEWLPAFLGTYCLHCKGHVSFRLLDTWRWNAIPSELWEPFSITSQPSWDITDEGNVINNLIVIRKLQTYFCILSVPPISSSCYYDINKNKNPQYHNGVSPHYHEEGLTETVMEGNQIFTSQCDILQRKEFIIHHIK